MIQLRRSPREVYRVYAEDDFFRAEDDFLRAEDDLFGAEDDFFGNAEDGLFGSPGDDFFDSAKLAEGRAVSTAGTSERRLRRVAGVAILAGALGTVGWVTTVGGISRAGTTGRTVHGVHAGGRRLLARQVLRTPASIAAVRPSGSQRTQLRGESARVTRHRATRHRATRHQARRHGGTHFRRVDRTRPDAAAGRAELPTISAPSTGVSPPVSPTRPRYQEFGFER